VFVAFVLLVLLLFLPHRYILNITEEADDRAGNEEAADGQGSTRAHSCHAQAQETNGMITFFCFFFLTLCAAAGRSSTSGSDASFAA
jgi:hypothetical protein